MLLNTRKPYDQKKKKKRAERKRKGLLVIIQHQEESINQTFTVRVSLLTD